MARLTRERLRLFGETGVASYFGKFGSKAAGSPVNTKDIATIQSLSAWQGGLQEACVLAADGSKAPFLEDINAMQYVNSYQQSYIFQEGIPEWEANVTYYKGSIVKRITSGTSEIDLYISLTDNNINNALPAQSTSNTNWCFQVTFSTGDLVIAPTKRFFIDGGGDTYIKEATANYVELWVGGNAAQYWTGNTASGVLGDFRIESTKKIHLDGGGDTYISETSANTVNFYAGGVQMLNLAGGTPVVQVLPDFSLQPLKKLFLDGSGDTYITESSANVVKLYCGGSLSAQFNASGISAGQVLQDIYFTSSTAGSNTWHIIPTSNLYLSLYSGRQGSWQERFRFGWEGTAYADGDGWMLFSPNIRKHKKFSEKKKLTGKDYLDWAVEDANKPFKPYKGIPKLKEGSEVATPDNNVFDTDDEVNSEISKYGKNLGKIAIGIAKWAEQAELRLQNLEAK